MRTICDIKNELQKHLGRKATINYNLGRNKFEEYHVVIKKLYDNIFLVEDDISLKSFSYSDVITKTIKIKYWQKL